MANRPGLWANIRAKRARGEKMRKKGEKGAPTPDQIKRAQGKSESPEIGGVKMKKLGSNPGSYKRLVKKHLGKSPDEKITKSDGDKIIAIAKKKGDKELAKKGSFIKNVIAEGPLDDSGQSQYGKGIGGKDEKKQKKAFDRNKKRYAKNPDDPRAFEPTAVDKAIMKKRKEGKMKDAPKSKYSENLDENQKALANKAKESGEPLGVLKKVYKRGLAAYASGHRPGMTQHQWAMARVNSYIKGGKARTVDKDLREQRLSFKEFIVEAPADEIKVGGYQTSHHYMCPSAVKFLKKHMRMDHDVQDLEDIARLSDDVFKIEADVEKAGKSTDEQVKSAQRLTNMVYDIVKKMGHKKEEAGYMDLHMDAIKNPDKAGSMKA